MFLLKKKQGHYNSMGICTFINIYVLYVEYQMWFVRLGTQESHLLGTGQFDAQTSPE